MRLLQTPLYHCSLEAGARFTDFAGWAMALQYTGVKKEHQAVRKDVGMFDISHMGKFELRGEKLLSSLQFLVPSDLQSLQAGEAKYTVLLNEQGGIIDDIIFYYQGKELQHQEKGIAIVNAARTSVDFNWLRDHLTKQDVEICDRSQQMVLIALQGPRATDCLNRLVEVNLADLGVFEHRNTQLYGGEAFVARTGYTGEDGFEIMAPPQGGEQLWRSLLAGGVIPCGLGARDTLRLEAGMCLYGQDIDETTTPLEAGLGWLVNWDSQVDFIGRPVLERQKKEGVKRRLVGLEMQGRHIARHGYAVVKGGRRVGTVTSGTLSPTLDKAIALAYVPTSSSKIGSQLEVEIRGKNYPATVVKKNFYKNFQWS